MMLRSLRVASVVLAAATISACAAKAQARTEVEMPVLDPPPPPPRVVATYAPEEPAPVPAPIAEAPAPSPSRPAERPPRPDPTAKVEPPKVEPPAPAPPRPSLTLKPVAGSEAQTEAAIRSLLQKASRDLSRVNPASLGTDGRAQYDTAKRFLQQAEEALKEKNLVYAGTLADKAVTLAAVFAR